MFAQHTIWALSQVSLKKNYASRPRSALLESGLVTRRPFHEDTATKLESDGSWSSLSAQS